MDAPEKVPPTPATIGLAASWIAVFVAMIAYQGGLQTGGDFISSGISPLTSHPFGDLSTSGLLGGQIWTALTATFIHYSILHIFFNLLGLYQLGRLVESWYGGAQFLGLYVVIGFVGNLLAGLSKPVMAWALAPWITVRVAGSSGGGSGVLCGLIAMLAVVGWRSKSRYGDYLKAQMLGVLGFTAILGIVIPHIDNFGHAGGAIVGALCGFLDPVLLRRAAEPKKSRWIGVVSVLAIVASFGLQWHQVRSETRAEAQGIREIDGAIRVRRQTLEQLNRLGLLFRELARRGPKDIVIDRSPAVAGRRPATRPEIATAAEGTVKSLEKILASIHQPRLGNPRTDEYFKDLFELTRRAEARRPMPNEIAQFDREFVQVVGRIQGEQVHLARLLNQLQLLAAERVQPAQKKKKLPVLGKK